MSDSVYRHMGKRGLTSFNMLIMITRMIFLVVALLCVVIIINLALNMNLETKETEANLLIGRMLYSPEGISHVDPITGRVVTGVIDVNNLNNTRLDNGLYIRNNNRISARVTLYRYGELDKGIKVGTVLFNKDYFEAYEPIADALYNVGGIGGVLKFHKKYPVIILNKDGKKEEGYVFFKVLIPKGVK